MRLTHDPRPASRYQAVAPSSLHDQPGVGGTAAMPAPSPTGSRVLRRLPAQLIRISDAR